MKEKSDMDRSFKTVGITSAIFAGLGAAYKLYEKYFPEGEAKL
jgi:hypothetical protein